VGSNAKTPHLPLGVPASITTFVLGVHQIPIAASTNLQVRIVLADHFGMIVLHDELHVLTEGGAE
jgi:hypothetical protein